MVELKTREKNVLAEKHIENEYQLRRWLPIRYIDNSKETGADESLQGKHAVIVGKLLSCETRPMQSRPGEYLFLRMRDRISGKTVRIFAFGQSRSQWYFEQMCGQDVFASGKLSFDQKYGFSLSVQTLAEFNESCFRIIPVFSKIRGMSDKRRDVILTEAVGETEEDTVPEELRKQFGVIGISDALKFTMFPQAMQEVSKGKLRLLFDDLFYMASRLALSEREEEAEAVESFTITTTALTDSVREHLPFALTDDQQATTDALIAHMKAGEMIRALVQGDVGCGKTITAFLPLIATAENGFQACLVAPTKILAEQHYQKLTALLPEGALDVRLFAGNKIKKQDREALADGTCKIAVGTHSLLQESVSFADLKYLVIDEEQKFGVAQRQFLEKKQKGTSSISMTATPIPRTLAGALYTGKTEVYSIKQMPAGRLPIMTQWDDGKRRKACVDYILKRKEQVYVVCPAIDGFEDEDPMHPPVLNTKKALELYRDLFPEARIETMDGTMKADQQDAVLGRFRAGETDILISTTVVEVGVDVPNATLMIMENAERFGLSQMHQLRGRVGRGDKQSYCLLISCQTRETNARIDTMCRTNDGFRIAEIDLRELRHSGDLYGEEQSGFNVYVEEMLKYSPAYREILDEARKLPTEILEKHTEKMLLCELRGHKRVLDPSKV